MDALVDEPHNSDLVNTSEGISLRDTASPSLDIGFPKSSCSLGLSHLIGQLDVVKGTFELEDTYSVFRDAYMETFFLLPHFLHGVASSSLMLLSLPKGRHVSCRHWIIFFL